MRFFDGDVRAMQSEVRNQKEGYDFCPVSEISFIQTDDTRN